MRKLIVEHWISLDGYAADVNGKTDFFPTTEQNRASDEDQLKFLDSIDIILLGRKTYELFADFWPKADVSQEILSDKLNGIPKIVFSNTLKKAPWGKWPEANIVSGEVVDAVKKLKKGHGNDIVVWGSISLVQALLEAELVDEQRVHICPVRIGRGLPLFPQESKDHKLDLVDTKVYNTGVIFSRYVTTR